MNSKSRASALTWFSLVLILLAAALFRFYGLDWDRGYLFHPDERKILLVASGLALPSNLPELLSPDSPLNPKFFAYGSFPIYLLKALSAFAPPAADAVPWRDTNLVGLALLGRALSGLFDLGTIALTFLLARRLFAARVGLVAAACIAVTVMHIQLAHFYAVDTLLTFFVVATIFFAARFADTGARGDALLMSVSFGLAMATKVSAAPLVVPIGVAAVRAIYHEDTKTPSKNLRVSVHHNLGEESALSSAAAPKPSDFRDIDGVRERLLLKSVMYRAFVSLWWMRVWSVRQTLAKIFGVACAVFVATQPYALLDPIRYFGQVGTESLVARGWLDFPYTRQFADTLPFLYQIWQSSVWGFSLPLGILAWGGSALFIWQWRRSRDWQSGFILSWALVYFVIIGAQYAKYPRYMLPLAPFLFLMAAVAFSRIRWNVLRLPFYVLFSTALVAASVYSLAFVSIYSNEHPWLQISDWIYQNIPAQSAIAIEHWDDVLPLSIRAAGVDRAPIDYREQVLPMYDADDATKTRTLVDTLTASDYIILASPRLYATITRLPARYPVSARYYRLLFNGQLGFDLVAFARNDPRVGGVTIVDDPIGSVGLNVPPLIAERAPSAGVWNWGRADESFIVYDHPMPLVFKKTRALTRAEIQSLLTSP